MHVPARNPSPAAIQLQLVYLPPGKTVIPLESATDFAENSSSNGDVDYPERIRGSVKSALKSPHDALRAEFPDGFPKGSKGVGRGHAART